VVLARPEGHRDPDYLLATIRGSGITTVNLVPSLLQLLLEHPDAGDAGGLRRVLCGGEPLPAALLERARERLPAVEIHNLYGPSEAATAAVALHCEPGAEGPVVSLGRPVANTRAYVLDAAGQPVPAGVAGELYVGGAGVSRGYLGRPDLTAERFVADPFARVPGARLYRTGDLCRWRANGRLEFVGRTDFQVKVRGFRVEPGEVESRLAEHPAVCRAAVLVREDVPGDQRLAAYFVADEAVEADALRAHLAARLPEYMVPSAFVRLGAMPLTPNGKLDRKALPAPEAEAYAARGYEAPEGSTEEAIAAIWAEVLRVERVGRHDHFFQLGGHSLLAGKVVLKINRELDVEVGIRDVFEAPLLSELARRVLDAQLAEFDPEELARLASDPTGF
jgi:acyl-CoA synthetase (AMP-forming)/AMP-acid ligase II